jgi:hypothetical protein
MTYDKYRDFMKDVELAAMFDDDDGLIYRPYQSRINRVPGVIDLEDYVITWRWGETPEDDRDRSPSKPPNLLMEFTRLADPKSGDKAILAFARKWGVLEICRHGLPCSHHHLQEYFMPHDWCGPLRYTDGERRYYESTLRWKYFAEQARALLSVAVLLRQGKPGRKEDWKVIFKRKPEEVWHPKFHGEDYDIDKRLLIYLVNRWLALGNVRPILKSDGEREFITFDTNLFGVLATQLMMVVCRTSGLGICSGCGMLYTPRRRQPKFGQRNYCQECGKKAAWRDAKAAERRRERAK